MRRNTLAYIAGVTRPFCVFVLARMIRPDQPVVHRPGSFDHRSMRNAERCADSNHALALQNGPSRRPTQFLPKASTTFVRNNASSPFPDTRGNSGFRSGHGLFARRRAAHGRGDNTSVEG